MKCTNCSIEFNEGTIYSLQKDNILLCNKCGELNVYNGISLEKMSNNYKFRYIMYNLTDYLTFKNISLKIREKYNKEIKK